jgi:hypothetical protein
MAELIHEFPTLIEDHDGNPYIGRVYAEKRGDGMWEGWLAFVAADSKLLFETGRETVQGSKQDLATWATGLEAVYLDGALERARERHRRASAA